MAFEGSKRRKENEWERRGGDEGEEEGGEGMKGQGWEGRREGGCRRKSGTKIQWRRRNQEEL